MDKINIRHFSTLAKLELSEDEILGFQKDIQSILNYIELMSELDLNDVRPTSPVAAISNVMRKDVPEKSLAKSEVLKNAPEILNGDYIKVPAVLEDDTSETE